jgi:hypothetical protein
MRGLEMVFMSFIMGSNRSVLISQEEIQTICDETGRFVF